MIRIDDYHRRILRIDRGCPRDIADKWLKVWDIDPKLASSLFEDYSEVFLDRPLIPGKYDEPFTFEDLLAEAREVLHGIDLDALRADVQRRLDNL